uniref:Uncharacterized protein n=2 Tax=Dendroctonus ponderosae TaxID=77166 RepID=A0AAR5P530_DENPD
MDLPQSKLFALTALGMSSILVGLLPGCFTKQSRTQWPLFLSCLLCFGGGVLLCTSLAHILPEAREAAAANYKKYTELIFCLGFFILYLMDEIVHYFYGEIAGHNHNHEDGHLPHIDEGSRLPERYQDNFTRRHSNEAAPLHRAFSSQGEREPLLRPERQLPFNPHFFRAKSDSALLCDDTPSQLCHVMHKEPCATSMPTTNFALLVALSIHSVLEGLVVGLERMPSKVLLLLGAVASHKLVVGFCLGVELASNEYVTFCKHFICIFVFSVSSVAGILIGMLIFNVPTDVTDIAIPILQALAGGTLLYVTVCEVLPRERARWHQKNLKKSAGVAQLLSVSVGFALMALLSNYLATDAQLHTRINIARSHNDFHRSDQHIKYRL